MFPVSLVLSLLTAGGTGLEAFFTMEGVLVVAVCTKKDYMVVSLPEHPLTDCCWVRYTHRYRDRGWGPHFILFPIQCTRFDQILFLGFIMDPH